MLEMRLNSGSFKINDDNTVEASKDIADAIKQGCMACEDSENEISPEIIVKDADQTGRKE